MTRRSFTRGIHVSGLGSQAYRTVSGTMLERLEASPRYTVNFSVNAGVAGAQDIGMLGAGAYVYALINHIALSSGTIAVSLIDPAGVASAINLDTDLALNAAAANATGAFLTPTAQDRIVRATVTSGTSGETAVMGLDIGMLIPDYT